MNATTTPLRDSERLHAQALARAQWLRRQAVAGFGQGTARALAQLAARLLRRRAARLSLEA
ncbi:MAG TPA: hypothetical protein VLJ58_19040 [Ramlibacter sp.]|nr:hypothetical protein [Ramlibacter sp.]